MAARHAAADGPGARSAPARRLTIDDRGRASLARQVRSPNCDDRPPGVPITLLVIHNISLPPGEFGGRDIERLFTNRLDPRTHPAYPAIAGVRVSAHFFIRRDGGLVQFVRCGRRAWHAGASQWKGRDRCNDFSIGIELEGTDDAPYTSAQYRMLARLVKALGRRYPIRDLAGHSDIAPGRKSDPGPSFDWARLQRMIAPRPRR